MRFVRLLKGHLPAFIACFLLLVVQAWSDLALPGYMSRIVDVGIQQQGIESPLPQSIRQASLDDLELFMAPDDAAMVESAYGEPDAQGVRHLTETDRDKISQLEELVVLPETIVLGVAAGVDAPQSAQADGATPANMPAFAGGSFDLDDVRAAQRMGMVTNEQLVGAANEMASRMGAMAGSILEQRGIAYVAWEYAEQGVDVAAVQSEYLGRTAGIMFAYCAVALAAAVLVGFIASRTAATAGRDTRKAVFSKVMRFSPAEVNKFSQASLITRCTNDVQQVQMVSVMFMRMVMLAPIMGVVALVRVLDTHTGLEWTIAVALVAVLAGAGLLLGFTLPKFKLMQKLIDRVNLKGREMLDGLMPMRAFGRQSYELEGFADASTQLMATQLFTSRAMALAMPMLMLVMNVVTLGIVWFGAHGVDLGEMQVGDMMAFISYTMQIIMSFMILSMVFIMLPRASVAADRICEVLDQPLSIVSPANPQAPAPDAPRGVVAFEDVTFSYPDATEPAVEHVSFVTGPGKTTAIIGPTGSGKSTVVQLIPRLFDATSGRVTVDGVDVRSMDLSDLRSRIGYVPQKATLFSGSIASNVGFGVPGATDEQLERACETAQASEFIAEKEQGIDSPVSQRGANVSGGQRQRLSIARALAVNPEILVFDDSFSALDYATDARLRNALERDHAQAAVVVVAQRIATVMRADEIVVLDEGKVVGKGTHEELLRNCPTYLEIAKSQLSPAELGLDGEGDLDVPVLPAKGGEL